MRRASLFVALCVLASAAPAVQPGFDPRDIPRHVRSARSPLQTSDRWHPGLADGEFLVDTSITHIPEPSYQSAPTLAFDGTNYLVVWEDWRRANCDIYGARVTQAGIVLDPDGIPIVIAGNHQQAPAVAFDGTNFLVVWEDWRSDTADVYGARVTQAGVVLEPNGIAVSTAANTQRSPTVAFDGASFLVAWQDDRKGRDTFDIYGARVNQSGTVLDSVGIPLATAAGDQVYPAVSFGGANFLVAWQDSRNGNYCDIYGARIAQTGTVLDPDGLVISTAANYQLFPSVAFDGTSFLVVWEDFRGTGDYSHIYGARVAPAGAVLDTSGISISPTDYDQKFPAVAFDGTNYLVVWEDWRGSSFYDIYGARVTPAAVVLEPDGIVISQTADAEYLPAVAFDGNNFLVVWQDFRGDINIYGGRVTPAAVVLDPNGIAIATAANDQASPAVGFDGTNYLVVWEDRRNGSELDLYGARVTPAGVTLDPSGFAISQAARDQTSPAVAFDGTNYLVVWSDHRSGDSVSTYGARVTPDGVVLDSNGIAISTAAGDQWSPAVAFDGTNYLVVWSDDRSGPEWDIYGARVTPAGAVLDTADIAISTARDDQQFVALAFDGANYLVAWADTRDVTDDIYGARVTPQGTVLEPTGIAISTAISSQRYPAVTFDGTNFLAVWEDWRGGSGAAVYGARVAPAGTVLDPSGIVISQATAGQYGPVVGYDQSNFLVAWEDCRSESSDICGARVRTDGTVFDEGPVVRQDGNQVRPALARGSGSELFLVYQGWAGIVGSNTYNTDRIWGKMNPDPGIAEAQEAGARTVNHNPTIVRGILFLGDALPFHAGSLFSLDGRKVLDLKPGPNDVSRLPAGAYFVRLDRAGSTQKLVVQR